MLTPFTKYPFFVSATSICPNEMFKTFSINKVSNDKPNLRSCFLCNVVGNSSFLSCPCSFSYVIKRGVKRMSGKDMSYQMTRQFLFYVFKVVWAVHHLRMGRILCWQKCEIEEVLLRNTMEYIMSIFIIKYAFLIICL